MRSRGWWIGLGLIPGLILGLPAQGEPTQEAVRKLMEQYQREAAPSKPAATPKPRSKPAPKPRPKKPAPKPRPKPTPAPTLAPIVPTPESVLSVRTDVPEMVRIPGGCFQMGSPDWEEGRSSDERQHRVCVDTYEIGKYEVTQGQWQAVMGDNPSYYKSGDDHPVEQVSWADVQTYLQKLNARTGQNYRLPTEAEWEYAARAGTTTAYWWGNQASHEHANYGTDECCSGLVQGKDRWENTAPVGSFEPNPWGLYDTVGNVLEWTCSLYEGNEDYSGAETRCIYNDASGPRSLRGGSWDSIPARVRSADRFRVVPTNRDNDRGFRLARSF